MLKRIVEILLVCVPVITIAQEKTCFKTLDGLPAEGIVVFSLQDSSYLGVSDSLGCLEINSSQNAIYTQSSFYSSNVYYLDKDREFMVDFKYNQLHRVVISAAKFKDTASNLSQHIEIIRPDEISESLKSNSADVLESTGKAYVQKSQLGGGSPVLRGFE